MNKSEIKMTDLEKAEYALAYQIAMRKGEKNPEAYAKQRVELFRQDVRREGLGFELK